MTKVIAISGKQGAGKTTLANAIQQHFRRNGIHVEVFKFAAEIYAIHDFAVKRMRENGIYKFTDPSFIKDGYLLQFLGTDWGRRINENIWVDILLKKLKAFSEKHPNGVAMIDDCRFENEFTATSDAFHIRLKAPDEVRKVRAETWRDPTHPSETGLDAIPDSAFGLVLDSHHVTAEENALVAINALVLTMTKELGGINPPAYSPGSPERKMAQEFVEDMLRGVGLNSACNESTKDDLLPRAELRYLLERTYMAGHSKITSYLKAPM